jgi:hypothetical protein
VAIGQFRFLDRFFSCVRFRRASFFSRSFFDTVSTMLSALLIRSASVLPGTSGAGAGFISIYPFVSSRSLCRTRDF